MPLKLKMDGDKAIVQDGKPVYIDDDGKEIPQDIEHLTGTIRRLNGEAKTHREAKEAAETKLKAYEGIDDPNAAREALKTVENLDAGKLIEAGKVEEIKVAARKAAEDQVAAAVRKGNEDLQKVTKQLDETTQQFHMEKIGNAFSRSKFISEKIAVPVDMVQSTFGPRFRVEEGKIVAYDGASKMYSRVRSGDVADFDEALEMMVDSYPARDRIIKGVGSGSGSRGNGQGNGNGNGQGGKQLSRADFEKMDPAARAKVMTEGTQLVD